jgi:hypothetical protein
MTTGNLDTSAFPEGTTAVFRVVTPFGQSGLLQGATGGTFVVQPLGSRSASGGGDISTMLVPNTDVTFTVERAFDSGYLVLSSTVGWFLATLVATCA